MSLRRSAVFALGASFSFALGNGCATTEDIEPTLGDPVPQGGSGFGGATGSGGSFGGTPSTGTGGTTKSGAGGKSGTGGKVSAGGAIFGGSRGGATGVGTAGKSSGGAGGKSSTLGMGGKSAAATGGKGGATAGAGGCDWTSCSAQSCTTACPTNSGTYCAMACNAYITCFQGNPGCSKAGDPLCVVRTNGVANVCTMTWESAGGPQTGVGTTGSPSAIAANYVACACNLTIPGVTSTGTGTGGAFGGLGTGGKSSSGGKAGF